MNKPKITVVGSLNMDMLIEIDKQPAKGETILGNKVTFATGGKGANQAIAARRLGAEVAIIGKVGLDEFGLTSIKKLNQSSVNTDSIIKDPMLDTGIASIYISEKNNSIVVIPGANDKLMAIDIDKNIDKIRSADVVLLQLEVPVETVLYTAKTAKKFGKKVILNPAPAVSLPLEIFRYIDVFTPNETELEFYAGEKLTKNNLEKLVNKVNEFGNFDTVVTLGSKGSAYMLKNKDKLIYEKSKEVSVVDTTGAGDSYNGALAVGIANRKKIPDAIRLASLASALSVSKLGAQEGMPYKKDVLKYLENI